MTLQQQLFANEYVKNGGNGSKAIKAIKPHLQDNSARASASILVSNINVLREIYRQAAVSGLTLPRVIGSISQALDSTKPLQASDGSIVEHIPDHSIRLRAADQACKLLRLYPGGGDAQPGSGNRHLHLHLDESAGPGVLEGLADRQARRQRKQPKASTDLTVDAEVVSSEQTAASSDE